MQNKKRILLFTALLLSCGLFFSFSADERLFEIQKNIKIYMNLYQEVNKYYVDEVNPTELMNSGIESMLKTLDPYTNYIPEDQIENYRTMTTGEYGGVGIIVGHHEGKTVVVMPNEGYSAHKAGIEIGDEILKIDGVELFGKNSMEISKLLKGQSGTSTTLTIKRYGKDKPFDVPLERERVQLKNVPYYGMVTENIGMIQLTDFTRDASKEVKNALEELKVEGADKIIIDLRGNPGGLLNEAIDISNLFVPKGSEIVSTKGKIQDWNRVHRGMNMAIDTEIPIAVLINEHSASAAEIVSGVIQDYDRGVLVGRRSFGKGLVQATRSLDFNSKLKVTVAKYYIPSGRCIQEIDYSLRDEDGNAEKVPDSLRVAFKTKNGRTVYDGGGVSPDIEVEKSDFTQITETLIEKGLIFDYATRYKFEHTEIVNPKKFELTDAEYDAFIAWLKGKDYNYRTKVESSLEKLVASAKEDKYFDRIEEQIRQLESKIYSSKEGDLFKFKEEIKEELEAEIASRYFLEKGKMEATFDDDPDVAQAVKVLNDPARYQKILTGN